MSQFNLSIELFLICVSLAVLVCCLQQVFTGRIAGIRAMLPLTIASGALLLITCWRFVQSCLIVLQSLRAS